MLVLQYVLTEGNYPQRQLPHWEVIRHNLNFTVFIDWE